VTHAYYQEREDNNFTLGPINLVIEPGELIFLVGGNGSGKTTIAKLLTGLYSPDSGMLYLDQRPVTDENRNDYRQLFSAVFSDFYVFGQLLGIDAATADARAHEYLTRLQLEHKVSIREGILSTTDLSQGQRKRLALLTAYLEDRPIYLFDEWAADQDPLFKEVFYLRLLPELKARGKTVIVITHDDRYYYVADRIIKLDYGKLVSDSRAVSLPLESQRRHDPANA
jgi:putative ATP-binding cassette transporter